MEPLIKIQNLTVGYDKLPVLKKVNFEIFEKDFIGVIGPNGGGKTTLLKAVLGLLNPVEGKIEFRKDINGRKKSIGYLPQVRHIDRKFPITVFDVVRSGSLMHSQTKIGGGDLRQKVEELLSEMGISNIRNKAIGELSGGQMQRVFLCRALLSDPKILILDEPDTFVDNRFEGELYEKLRFLNQEVAIILVSHDLGTISSYVKTIACVNGNLHYHQSNSITQDQLDGYNCPIQIITHGEIPHTVLKHHH
ncbi:MAG: metal ABC transporter ATP-binding protein [Prolixibacteraceae bacterium]|mgnify:CR=1 FL=1|jgi:zinc transport system ATP-binding protein|nr:metal ABC transporter ATP-binding protein [Prolixibacteraceae bacterium]MBT6764854.1 metal ABC transporter ATP-binding protein [Prolixibacteraceae bacterium]MBT6998114.1 metal ABC transporter ATP-binding protein [Prolixibacteraceae bacterium]MBT7393930.1 metal ABC transporter ATP-binding protein [Prolixibacteraceae bacterium]